MKMIEYIVTFVCIIISCYMFLHARVLIESGELIIFPIVFSIISYIFGLFALISFITTYKENRNGKNTKEETTETKAVKQAKKETNK